MQFYDFRLWYKYSILFVEITCESTWLAACWALTSNCWNFSFTFFTIKFTWNYNTTNSEFGQNSWVMSVYNRKKGIMQDLSLNVIVEIRLCYRKNLWLDGAFLTITVRHHSASLIMPNSYPWDRISNLRLRTTQDSSGLLAACLCVHILLSCSSSVLVLEFTVWLLHFLEILALVSM